MTDLTDKRVDVSIVLPVQRAGQIATRCSGITKAMDAADSSYEMSVVDDGSTDRSGEERILDGKCRPSHTSCFAPFR